MRPAWALLCAVVGAWLLIGGPVGIMFGLAVMEAAVVVAGGFGLVLLTGVLLLADLLGPRR